jgi:putative phosphoesterase
MKIALLGDIHANLPALEAVLEHARQQGAQVRWNIGDYVGYGAFPEEVVQLVQQENIPSIAGNYDRKVLRFPKKQGKWRTSKRPEKYFAFQWAYENLSANSRQYLQALPAELRLQVEGWEVLLTHGSPASIEEPLTPDTPLERLLELAELAAADLVICGHSHQPFTSQAGDAWFINTGSIGRPDDGDPRAAYALLELTPKAIQVQHFRLEYDVERAAAEVRRRGLPEAFAQMVLQGYDLDRVLREDDAFYNPNN